MNGDKRGKKLITACVCIFVSVVFLITSFVQKKAMKEDASQKKQIQESIEAENEPEPELYQEGNLITIYFTNTGQIDEKGALPHKELELLAEKTQEFLRSKGIEETEVQVIDGSLKKKERKTYFSCKVGKSILEIGFDEDTETFDFILKEGGT
jgi:frataxin-like iron-binding protein CyaY